MNLYLVRVEFIVKKEIFRIVYVYFSRQTIRSIDSYLNLSFSSKHSIVIVSIIMQHYAHG